MASIAAHTDPLDKRLVKHLLRRACFHYSKEQLDAMIGKTASEVLAHLDVPKSFSWNWPNDPITNGAKSNCANTQDGYWINDPSWTHRSFPCRQTAKRGMVAGWWWYNTMKRNTLIDKLTWFLFTTFTVSKDDGSGRAAHFFDYINLLQFYADKSVKDLARKITFDNSILYYLDNGNNNKNNPNENYAREFLELFTIGKGPQVSAGDYTNYTEHDVIQAARIFSGIKFKRNRDKYDTDTIKLPHYPNGIPTGYINFRKHDTGSKRFSYAFDYRVIEGGNKKDSVEIELDDFVNMIFDKLETAKNYVRKMYRMYVCSEWDKEVENDIITPLAQQLQDNGYNLLDVLQTLLKSKHFFDMDNSNSPNGAIGGIVKNPLQFLNEIVVILGVQVPNPDTPQIAKDSRLGISNENFRFYLFWWHFCHNSFFKSTGMNIFAPSTVAGYPADYQSPSYDKAWFNSNTIVARYNTIKSFIGSTYNDNYGNGDNRIKGLQTRKNGKKFHSRIWTHFNSTEFIADNFSDPANTDTLIQELSELLYCESIDADRIAYFKKSLIKDGEVNYIWDSAWSAYLNASDAKEAANASIFIKNRLNDLISRMINAAEFQLM